MGSTPVTVLMSFKSEVYWLDEELRRIQSDCMLSHRKSLNQSRPGHSLKRHTDNNPEDCKDCDESQTAELNTAHSVTPANTIIEVYNKKRLEPQG